jgi:hypothetical protein
MTDQTNAEAFTRSTVIVTELDVVRSILDGIKAREWVAEDQKIALEGAKMLLDVIRSEHMTVLMTHRLRYDGLTEEAD